MAYANASPVGLNVPQLLKWLKKALNIGPFLPVECATPTILKNIPPKRSGMAGNLKTRLLLKRTTRMSEGVIGELYVNDNFECFTLEHPQLLIVPGSYGVEVYNSPSRGYQVPLLQDVPQRSYIEIHIGNTEKDTAGCILVGLAHDHSSLIKSRLAFEALLPKIVLPANITITN